MVFFREREGERPNKEAKPRQGVSAPSKSVVHCCLPGSKHMLPSLQLGSFVLFAFILCRFVSQVSFQHHLSMQFVPCGIVVQVAMSSPLSNDLVYCARARERKMKKSSSVRSILSSHRSPDPSLERTIRPERGGEALLLPSLPPSLSLSLPPSLRYISSPTALKAVSFNLGMCFVISSFGLSARSIRFSRAIQKEAFLRDASLARTHNPLVFIIIRPYLDQASCHNCAKNSSEYVLSRGHMEISEYFIRSHASEVTRDLIIEGDVSSTPHTLSLSRPTEMFLR